MNTVAARTDAPTPAENLAAYATVQRGADAEILRVLRDAYADSSRELAALGQSGRGSGSAIRRDQIRAVQKSLLERQAEIFRRTGNVIERKRAEAAAKAIQVAGRYDEVAFAALGREAEARALARGLEETELRTIDAAIARMTGSHIALSTRVYRAQAFTDGMLERRINSGLARGLSAEAMARELRDFVNPSTPGGTRYAALRLARSEINNAYHAMSIRAAQLKPWITKMEWHKSASHVRKDICDPLDGELFAVEEVPPKPHPQCLCIVTPVVDDNDDAFLDALTNGSMDDFLDKFADQHGIPGTVAPSLPSPLPTPTRLPNAREVDAPDLPTVPASAPAAAAIPRTPAESIAIQLENQRSLAPKALAQLRQVRMMTAAESKAFSARHGKDALGGYVVEEGVILVHPQVASAKYAREFKKSVATGFYSKAGPDVDAVQSFIAHETGHHLDKMLRRLPPEDVRGLWKLIGEEIGLKPSPFGEQKSSIDRWVQKNHADLKKAVSEYGAEDSAELIAEIWNEYSTNPNARKHIKAIGKRIQELAEKAS